MRLVVVSVATLSAAGPPRMEIRRRAMEPGDP